jgi:hypothetical protein
VVEQDEDDDIAEVADGDEE